MRVLITGACGYIGRRLVAALREADWVERVAGLDVREPPEPVAGLVFVKRDVREPLDDILSREAITTVVHLAYVVAPVRDTVLTQAVNEQGTRNVLEACRRYGVRHFLYTSSVGAYGLHADNDVPLTESSPLRGNDDFAYTRTKRRIERMIERFAGAHQDVAVTVLRPSFIVGPGFADPLAAHLRKRVVILPRRTQPLQFVHEADLTNILTRFIRTRQRGTYNVGAAGTMTLAAMIERLGNFRLGFSWPTVCFFNELAWRLGLRFVTEVPSAALRFLVHPCVMSSEKLLRETGYRFLYDTAGAFEDFARAATSRAPSCRFQRTAQNISRRSLNTSGQPSD
ncbi:MAG: NAD-dependent epimerase/dehydratase family protein [Sedimentisphaerales bacterium]|nr:NAD-dependent epimerase/dehydratase family protein [Sedimentisphaerales bacterium]